MPRVYTGAANPNFYIEQLERLGRAGAIMSQRQREEDERRRQKALQDAQRVVKSIRAGAQPPDSARVQVVLNRLEKIDPMEADILRREIESLTDFNAAQRTLFSNLIETKNDVQLTTLGQSLAALPREDAFRLWQSMGTPISGITEKRKREEPVIPKDQTEALLMVQAGVLSPEEGQEYLDVFEASEKEELQDRLKQLEEEQKVRAKFKDRPTVEDLRPSTEEIAEAQRKYFDDIKAQSRGRRPAGSIDAEARLRALAANVRDPAVAEWLQRVLALALSQDDESALTSAASQAEAKLKEKGYIR